MSLEFILFSLLIFLGFGILLWFFNTKLSSLQKKDENKAVLEWLNSMQRTIEQTNTTVNESLRGSTSDVTKVLQSNTKQLNERLDTAARVIGQLQRNLGEMAEVGKGIRSLQDFLQSPKLRGNIGEQVLSDMIGQTFPKNSFHLQYSFRSGAKVDAALQTDAGLLCIDSKFPMENFTLMHKGETEEGRKKAKKDFNSDVKKHLGDISKKYILPEENTLDFALMYIPSEAVYYEVVNTEDIMEFARKLRVYPVSPNTLYAHLQVLLLSFQGKELETKSREVMKLLRAIAKDYEKTEENLGVLGRHVTNSFNTMNTVTSSFGLLGQKLSGVQHLQDAVQSKQEKLLEDPA